MNTSKKTFAFKLATAKTENKAAKWEARDGVSVAGCSLASIFSDDARYNDRTHGRDAGGAC